MGKLKLFDDFIFFLAVPVPGPGLGTEGPPLPHVPQAAAQIQPGLIFLQNSRGFCHEKNSPFAAAPGWDRSGNKIPKTPKKNLKNQGNSAQNGTQIPFSGCWIQGVSWPQPTPKFSKTELKERTKFNILKFPFPGCFLRRGDAWEPEGQIDLESFNTKVFFELLLGQSRSVTTTLGQFKEEVKKSSFGAAFRAEKPQIE